MTPSSQAGNAPAETDGTLGELGEFGLIRRVATGRSQPAVHDLGPGDDAAVVAAPDGRVVASTDVLVETVHFRLDWSTPEQVGRRAAAANLADIAAMGAVPTALLVGLACPANTPVATLDRPRRRAVGGGRRPSAPVWSGATSRRPRSSWSR